VVRAAKLEPPLGTTMLNYFRKNSGSIKNDILSGLTVALALVPEAIAFAFVAGLSPLIGLYSAFFLGLLTAIFGGRPGMISGATGAMAVVIVSLVAIHGIEYLFPTVILCGIMQILIGMGRLGKLIRMVPQPVMLGFVNGLAIVIGMAQLGSFKTLSGDDQLVFMSGTPLAVMLGLIGLTMAIIAFLPKLTKTVPASLAAILTVSLISIAINQSVVIEDGEHLVPTVGDMLATNTRAAEKAKLNPAAGGHGSHGVPIAANTPTATQLVQDSLTSGVIPSGVIPSGVATANTAQTLHSDAPIYTSVINVLRDPKAKQNPLDESPESDLPRNPATLTSDAIADSTEPLPVASASISGGLPELFFLKYEMVPLTFATLKIIFPFAIILCGVGLIESLMTLTLIDEITGTRGRGNRECIGQGIANIVCGFFGGMGGCAMIGQSLINVNSGGRGRLSGITAAVCLLLFVLFLAPLIEQIPMAALVGVMFMVVIGTFEWASLKMFQRMPRADMFVMVLVAGYTVFMHDLASAVILGVVVSALVFAWQHATHMGADIKHNEHGSKIYQLHGPLFFASVSSFKEMFDVNNDPEDVVIDFYYSRVYDQSGLEAINTLAEKYETFGKRLHLTHLSPECRSLLNKAGDLVEVNVSEDPQYHIATDRLA